MVFTDVYGIHCSEGGHGMGSWKPLSQQQQRTEAATGAAAATWMTAAAVAARRSSYGSCGTSNSATQLSVYSAEDAGCGLLIAAACKLLQGV